MALPAHRLRAHKKGPEWTQPRQLNPNNQRDFPYQILSCCAIKAGGRKRKWKTFRVMTFVFPSHRCPWWSPAFTGMAAHLPVRGKQWKNYFSCFAAYLLSWLYLNPHISAVLPRFLSSSCQGGASKQSGLELPDGVKPWHLKLIIFLKTTQFLIN